MHVSDGHSDVVLDTKVGDPTGVMRFMGQGFPRLMTRAAEDAGNVDRGCDPRMISSDVLVSSGIMCSETDLMVGGVSRIVAGAEA